MELKFHKQVAESCVYYVWKYYIGVCYHSENINNLLHHTFFLRHPVLGFVSFMRAFEHNIKNKLTDGKDGLYYLDQIGPYIQLLMPTNWSKAACI